jgi:sulfur carrier protein
MKISVNGELIDIRDATTVDELMCQLGYESTQAAVALNLFFVPRSAYEKTRLQARDQVEIVMPVAGG